MFTAVYPWIIEETASAGDGNEERQSLVGSKEGLFFEWGMTSSRSDEQLTP